MNMMRGHLVKLINTHGRTLLNLNIAWRHGTGEKNRGLATFFPTKEGFLNP